MSKADMERVTDTLLRKRCRGKNPTQLPALCQALNITGEDLDMLPEPDLEELLADAIQLDARERRSRLEVIRDALVLGEVLTKARSLTGHGYWLDWLKQTGIPRQRAHERIQLWGLGMTAEQVQEAGGIRQVLRQKPAQKQAAVSQPQGANVNDCAQELAQAEAKVGDTKAPYYAALTRRRRAVNALHQAELAAQGANVR